MHTSPAPDHVQALVLAQPAVDLLDAVLEAVRDSAAQQELVLRAQVVVEGERVGAVPAQHPVGPDLHRGRVGAQVALVPHRVLGAEPGQGLAHDLEDQVEGLEAEGLAQHGRVHVLRGAPAQPVDRARSDDPVVEVHVPAVVDEGVLDGAAAGLGHVHEEEPEVVLDEDRHRDSLATPRPRPGPVRGRASRLRRLDPRGSAALERRLPPVARPAWPPRRIPSPRRP